MCEILLTFSIPVYNGESTILETLKSLSSLDGEDIEFLVTDNASTDSTINIVKKMQLRDHRIRIIQNSKNLGYDRNFNNCFQYAKGKYVWMVGDDDLIRVSALSKVRKLLKDNIYKFIFVNYAMVDRESGHINIERDVPIFSDTEFEPGISAVCALKEYPNFISSMIFDRQSWIESNYIKYFDTLYVQYGVFLEVTEKYKSYAISEPLVENKCRLKNLQHKPEFYKKYFSNLINILSILDGHSVFKDNTPCKRMVIRDILDRHVSKYIIVTRISGGSLSRAHFFRILQFFFFARKSPLILLLGVIPKFLFDLLRKVNALFRG